MFVRRRSFCKGSTMVDPRSLLFLSLAILTCLLTPRTASAESGRSLFFNQTFDGNGQTCGTCHREDQGLAFGPAFAQSLFATNTTDPLFVPLNARGASGSDFSLMFRDGAIPIPIDLPPNVQAVPLSPGAQVHTRADGSRFIFLNRKTPTVLNVALSKGLMLDGRNGLDFTAQALGAVDTHTGPHRAVAQKELEKIVRFEKKQFSDEAMKQLAKHGTPRSLPLPTNAIEQVGFSMMQADGKCGQCHGGPNLDQTTEFNVLDSLVNSMIPGSTPPGLHIQGNFSGNNPFNTFPGSPSFDDSPLYQFTFTNVDAAGVPTPDFFGVIDRVMISGDPGALLNPNEHGFADVCSHGLPNCLVNLNTPLGPSAREVFKIPSLWDVGDKFARGETMMHHGQAHTMAEVMEVYKDLFFITALGMTQLTGVDRSDLMITPEEEAGITAYILNRMRSTVPCDSVEELHPFWGRGRDQNCSAT